MLGHLIQLQPIPCLLLLAAAGPVLDKGVELQDSGVEIEVVSLGPEGVSLQITCGVPQPAVVQIGDRELPAIALDGAGYMQDPGYPVVPRRRFLVEIPDGADVRLSVVVDQEEPMTGLSLPPAPRVQHDPQLGTTLAVDSVFATTSRLLPEAPIRLEYVGWLRQRHVACLEYTPVRFDPATGEAVVARALRVTLQFQATRAPTAPKPVQDAPWFDSLYEDMLVNAGAFVSTPSPTGLGAQPPLGPGPSASSAGPQAGTTPTNLRWRLKVEADERGLYEITPADLQAAGVNLARVDPRRIGMSRRGQAIAIEVEGETDGSLDPTDRVLFFADPDSNKYRDINAWWVFEVLQGTGSGENSVLRMLTVDGAPQLGDVPVPFFRDTVRAETELKYWQTMPSSTTHDHWYWKRTLAPAANDYAISVPHPTAGGADIRVRAALHGYTNTTQDPDHHTRLLLNGNQVDDSTWDGITAYNHDVTVASALLQAGNNTLRVQQILDLGAVVSGIYSDWFDVEYDRDFIATGDELAWTYDTGLVEAFAIQSFSSQSIHALIVTDAANVQRLVNVQIDSPGSGYRATFRHDTTGGQQYFLADETVLRSPLSVAPGLPAIDVPALGADLLILAEPQFDAAIAPLILQRQQSGLRVAQVDPRAIYDAYSHGEFNPEAIRDFVQDAYENWAAPAPSFLLLVGEASLDYRDHWNNGPWNTAPGVLWQSPHDIELPSDHLYVTVAGSDPLPELFAGRLPAGSPQEAAALVAKILNYENTPPAGAWQTEVVHIADFGGIFATSLDAAAVSVPPTHTVTQVYADILGSGSATHNAILTELNQGCVMATYFGHGAALNWGAQLLDSGDVPGLSNGSRVPLVVALNCLNGFFALYDPPGLSGRSLAEEFLLAPGGSVACFAPSGLGLTWEYQRILLRSYGRIFASQSLGEILTGSKVDGYLIDGISEENLWDLLLFGDPSAYLLP